MHCIGSYPTEKSGLQLNQIDLLKKRYPEIYVGFSTHEEPDNMDSIKMAIAKGAMVFERHVGVETEKFPLNAYSSSPKQIGNWLRSAQDAFTMAGQEGQRYEISSKEINDLRGLKRGAFAKRDILKGERINPEDLFFAIPNINDQLLANDISKYAAFTANSDIRKNGAVMYKDITMKNLRENVTDGVFQSLP